jgi:hypothetical protein
MAKQTAALTGGGKQFAFPLSMGAACPVLKREPEIREPTGGMERRIGMTEQNATTRFATRTGARARGVLAMIRRVADRDTVLLTLNGASIPAAWVALWFVLAGLLTTE